ncbi:MAG: MBL fold metallo-hydrolase RNA specificity domain-containing protein, partial [Candidatus Micrarchaeaceae archaeon]
MKITFFGAAGEVGRSCFLVENDDTKILLDAGVKLTEQQVELPLIRKEELAGVRAIIISHAHLDHCGYLPYLFSMGFEGNIYATKPTLELANVIVNDYLKISKPKEVTKQGMAKMVRYYRNVEYFKEFTVGSFAIKLYPAGHILGSAMIKVDDMHTGKSLFYTGDMNTRSTRLLPPAYSEHLHADTIMTESTYGGNADVFPSEKEVLGSFINSIKETINMGNKVIIPSFAVGRAQEVLFILNDFMRSGILPQAPIYIDGMITKAMRIYRHNVIFCKEELQKQILMSDDDPFKSKFFNEVKGRHERSKVVESKESCIVVTTSGMLKGGPIVKYLEKLASNENDKLILVGYQAIGTPGRMLMEGNKNLEMNGKKIEIKMKVEQYKLSAHADRPSLLKFMGKISGLKNVIIIHGEPDKMAEFANALKDKY